MVIITLLKNQWKISNQTLKIISNNGLISGSHIRYISNVSQVRIDKTTLPKNMTLWQCLSNQSKGSIEAERRPLTLIFSWLLAKDKHLDKFRQLWFNRGFDVLTIQTSLLDALLPTMGSQIVAKNLVKTLLELSLKYDEIIVHSLSVGGYQYGEVLVELKKEEKYSKIMNSFKGVIMDSLVYAKDGPPGIAKTVTHNLILQPIIESSVKVFFKVFQRKIIKHYNNSEQLVAWNPPLKYPGLILYSKDDTISSFQSNENLIKSWQKCGNKIYSKCWDQSTHVLHYRNFQKEYEQELDSFIKSLNLKNNRI